MVVTPRLIIALYAALRLEGEPWIRMGDCKKTAETWGHSQTMAKP